MTEETNSNVQLLANLVDPDDEEDSEYRFLVDQRHIKYVTVAPGVLPKSDRTFAPALIPLLPPFPPGDWNEGHVYLDPTDPGRALFSRVAKNDLPGVEHVWHQTRIDLLQLKKVERVRQNIHLVTHPQFERPVLAKFAQFPWEMPYYTAETAAYEWIHSAGIGPAFLGHITEAGRVTGFLMEHIDNAKTAGPEDLAACQRSLKKLHALGILHGDINKHNFLVRGGEVVLVDFETAERTEDEEELEKEYRRLGASLGDPSTRGGPGIPVVSEQCPR